MQRAKRLLVVCMICVLAAISISLVACGHDHKFDKWDHDDTHHWKVCSVEGCTQKDDSTKAKHELDANGKCECGYEKAPTPPPPAHKHTYEDGKWADLGNGKHAKQCDNGDYTDNSTAADHTYVEGKCDKCDAVEPHTHTYAEGKWKDLGDGKHAKQCDKGDYTDNSTAADHTYVEGKCDKCDAVEPHTHTYDDGKWADIGDGKHAKQCDDGDYTDNSTAADHTYVEGKCDKCDAVEPHTHTYADGKWADLGNGKHAKLCDKCDYKDETTAADHTEFDTITTDSKEHWEECKVCGAEKAESRVDHNFVKVTTDPTEHWEACECGAEKAESRGNHNFVLGQGDATEHWEACECGAIDEDTKAAHGFADATEYVSVSATQHAAKCPTCGAANTAAPVDHNFSDEYKDQGDGNCAKECEQCDAVKEANEHSYTNVQFNTAQHWNECIRCGLEQAGSKDDHSFNGVLWTVIEEGANQGKHANICATCEAIDEANAHIAQFTGEDVEYVKVPGQNKHAAKCAHDGCNLGNYANPVDHVYEREVPDSQNPDQNKTEYASYFDIGGDKCVQQCFVCGAKDELDAKAHEVLSEEEETEYVDLNNGTHAQKCIRCKGISAASAASHNYVPHLDDRNDHWNECDKCKSEEAGTRAQHNVDTTKYETDADFHWYACEGCKTKFRREGESSITVGAGGHRSQTGSLAKDKWDDNEHYVECVDCKYHYKAESHILNKVAAESVASTCSTPGYDVMKCSGSYCGYTTKKPLELNPDIHEYDMVNAVDAADGRNHKYENSCSCQNVDPILERHEDIDFGETCSKCKYVNNNCEQGHVYDDSEGYAEDCSICGKKRPTLGLDPKLNDNSIFKLSGSNWLMKNTNSASDTTTLDKYVDALGEEILILPAKFKGTIVTGTNDQLYLGQYNTNNFSIVIPKTYTTIRTYSFGSKVTKIYLEDTAINISPLGTNNGWNILNIVLYCDNARKATTNNWHWVKGKPTMWTQEDIEAAVDKLPPEVYNEKATSAGITYLPDAYTPETPAKAMNMSFAGGTLIIPVSSYSSAMRRTSLPYAIAANGFKDMVTKGNAITAVVLSTQITAIEANAFLNAVEEGTTLVVYYGGTAEQWQLINIAEEGNDVFKSAKFFYFNGKKPETGVYNTWHWSDEVAEDAVPVEWHKHKFVDGENCECGEEAPAAAHVHKFFVEGTWHDECQDDGCNDVRSTVSDDVLNAGWFSESPSGVITTKLSSVNVEKTTINGNILVFPARHYLYKDYEVSQIGNQSASLVTATENVYDIVVIPVRTSDVMKYYGLAVATNTSKTTYFYVECAYQAQEKGGSMSMNYFTRYGNFSVTSNASGAIGSGQNLNEQLIYFYSEEMPSDSAHNYWHYETIDGVVTPVAWEA